MSFSFLGADFNKAISEAAMNGSATMYNVERISITQRPLHIEDRDRRWYCADVTFKFGDDTKDITFTVHGMDAKKGEEAKVIPVVSDTDTDDAKELNALRIELAELKTRMEMISKILEGK